MAAIIGRLSFDSEEILARTVLEQMLEASSRRTVDARSVFAAPGIALGWCGAPRDTSASRAGLPSEARGADLGLPTEARRADLGLPTEARRAEVGTSDRLNIRAVADSQLTNAGELRATLERDGHRFHARTDDELIAHAYDRWGTGAFERLRGPFACAVWDETNRRLVLARDHVGIRPLYFAVLSGHGVVFASEIQALLQDPGVSREWCANAVDAYLALGYIPAPLTSYRRVSKLEPAHFLVVDGRRLHVEEYWDLPVPSTETAPRDTVWAVQGALKSAVRRDLKDHKHAALLYSGGAASCALLANAPSTAGMPITVDLDQDPSELTRSDAAAAHLGRIRELETIAQSMSSLVEELTEISGEPIADPSAVTQFAMCKAAARYTPIALSGHGASVFWAPNARRRRLLSHLALPGGMEAAATRHTYRLWDGEHRRSIYTRGFAWQVRDANPFGRHLERYASRLTDDPVDRAVYVDARTFLPDNTLVLAERAAAAAGLTLRYPFLDRQMVELATATPSSHKQHGRIAMWVLRRLLMPQLPARLMPPALPRPARNAWLTPALTLLVPKMLLGPRFDGRGIVSRPALRQLWNDHLSARADHSRRLWALVMLEFWFRDFIDGDAAAEPLEYAVLLKAA